VLFPDKYIGVGAELASTTHRILRAREHRVGPIAPMDARAADLIKASVHTTVGPNFKEQYAGRVIAPPIASGTVAEVDVMTEGVVKVEVKRMWRTISAGRCWMWKTTAGRWLSRISHLTVDAGVENRNSKAHPAAQLTCAITAEGSACRMTNSTGHPLGQITHLEVAVAVDTTLVDFKAHQVVQLTRAITAEGSAYMTTNSTGHLVRRIPERGGAFDSSASYPLIPCSSIVLLCCLISLMRPR